MMLLQYIPRCSMIIILTLHIARTHSKDDTDPLYNVSSINGNISYNATFSVHYGHNLSHLFSTIAAGCFLTIILVAVIGNVILIATITMVPRLHSYMHVFIINMALSDLITALGTIPFDVELMLRGYFAYGEILCGIMHITFLVSLPSSVLSLAMLTAERFIRIIFPLKAHFVVTRRTVITAVIVTWIYILLVAFFPLMYNKHAIVIWGKMCYLMFPMAYQVFQVVVNFLIPSVIICGVNIVLLRISYQHASKMSIRASVTSSSPNNQNRKKKHSWPKRKASRISKDLSINIKALKRITLLVGVFIVCWLSYIIVVMTNYICRCHSREVTWIANIVNYSSTAINPLMYGLLNKTIRKEVVKMFHPIWKLCFPSCYKTTMMRKYTLEMSVEMPIVNGDSC